MYGLNGYEEEISEQLPVEEKERILQETIDNYLKSLHSNVSLSQTVPLDYTELYNTNLIEEPVHEDIVRQLIKHGKRTLKYMNNPNPELRLVNLPERLTKTINNIGAEDIGNLIAVQGTIIAVDEPNTRVLNAKFECMSCLRNYEIIQESNQLKTPYVCDECGARGNSFKLLEDESEFMDTRQIILEETNSEKTHQGRVKVIVEGDLTHEVDVNQEVTVIGIASRENTPLKSNNTNKLTVIKANNIIPLKEKQVTLTD